MKRKNTYIVTFCLAQFIAIFVTITAQTVVYSHNFDDRVGYTTDQSFCDASSCGTSDNRWGINSNPSCVSGFTGSTFYARDINSCGTNATEILVFPTNAITGNGDIVLEGKFGFDQVAINFSGTNTATFQYSFVSATGPWTTGSVFSTTSANSISCTNCGITGGIAKDQANDFTFSMNSGHAGTTLYLRLNVSGFDGSTENFFLDDIYIEERCSGPATPPSALSFPTVENSTMDLTWANNAGDRVLVLARESSVTGVDPELHAWYDGNNNFGDGTEVSPGIYAVYNGTGNSFSVDGLIGGESYDFDLYAFNSADTCYNLTQTSATQATSCTTGGPSSGTARFRTCSSSRGSEVSNGGSLSYSIYVGGSFVGTSLDASSGPNLRNVRIKLDGDGDDDINNYTCTLTAPDGTTSLQIFGSGSFTTNVTNIDAQFRDNTLLRPASYSTYSTMGMEPYNQGYYETTGAGGFGVFDGIDPRGNWTVTFTESRTSTQDDYILDFVELEFDTPFAATNDVRTLGDDCSLAVGLNSGVYYGTTSGKTAEATDPKDNVSGCNGITGCGCWNGSKDNSQWFKFYADQTNIELSISGMEYNAISQRRLQAVLLEGNPTACTGESNWNVVSCPETSDGGNSYVGTPGTHANIDLSFTAEFGKEYHLVIDGTAGAHGNYVIYVDGVSTIDPALPVELMEFNAAPSGASVNLDWSTASEINNSHFELQKSDNGENWVTIASVEGAGNSTTFNNYWTTDYSPYSGVNYYRLKQVDYNGDYEYSKVKTIKFENDSFFIVPNVISSGEPFRLMNLKNAQHLAIYQINGKLVTQQELLDDQNELLINQQFSKGFYLVEIIDDFGSKSVKRFIVE